MCDRVNINASTMIEIIFLFISQTMLSLSEAYNKSVIEETTMTSEQLKTRHVGKQDPKRHLEQNVESAMTSNIVQCLGSMLDSVSF